MSDPKKGNDKKSPHFLNAYEPFEFAMFRIPNLPLELYHKSSDFDYIIKIINKKSKDTYGKQIRTAILLSSPSFLDQLDKQIKEKNISEKAKRALIRYIIRMSTRPTPYGLFSSFTTVKFKDRTNLTLPKSHMVPSLRIDTTWYLDLLPQIEKRPETLRHLSFTTNRALLFHGERVFISERRDYSSPVSETVSMKATDALMDSVKIAAKGVSYGNLSAALVKKYGIDEQKAFVFISELVKNSIIISNVKLDFSTEDPVLESMSHFDPKFVEEKSKLLEIKKQAESFGDCDIEGRETKYIAIAKTINGIFDGSKSQPLQASSRLKMDRAEISSIVGQEAARAAELLIRLTPYPKGYESLKRYKERFISEYGLNREVPLIELLDPNLGLGPSTTASFDKDEDDGKEKLRSQMLLDLAVSSTIRHENVVELDQTLLDRLTTTDEVGNFPPTLDIFCRVIAPSQQAIDRGEFLLMIPEVTGGFEAGSTLTRFAKILGEEGRKAVAEAGKYEEAGAPGKVHAELVFDPKEKKGVGLAAHLNPYEYRIVADAPKLDDTTIPIDEIAAGVQATDQKFYLRWIKKDVEIVAHQTNMFNPNLMPDWAYFVLMASKDELAVLSPFDWRAAERLPFLPRLQCGRLIISGARWRIDKSLAGKLSSEKENFVSGFGKFRKEWNMPRFVYVGNSDVKLLLDLNSEEHLEELRSELSKLDNEKYITLDEACDLEPAWLRKGKSSYISEFAVPLRLKKMPSIEHRITKMGTRNLPKNGRMKPPGSEWLYLKLYSHKEIQDALLANELRAFCEKSVANNIINSYFFVRYSDPKNHIRLRLKGTKGKIIKKILLAVLSEMEMLMKRKMILSFDIDTYNQEIERYGSDEGMAISEEVFFVDSYTTMSMLAIMQGGSMKVDKIAVAALFVDTLLSGLGLDIGKRLEIYRNVAKDLKEKMGPEEKKYIGILSSSISSNYNDLSQLTSNPEAVKRILDARVSGLRTPGKKLIDKKIGASRFDKNASYLYSSYAHMCCNRFGIDGSAEAMVMILLKRTAETAIEKAKAGKP